MGTETKLDQLHIARLMEANQRYKDAEADLMKIRRDLNSLVDRINDTPKREYTGWVVLLKMHGTDKPEFVAIVNPSKEEEIQEYGWDVCLSIPTPGSMAEFEGW